jgi:UDP-glucose 4-epimerase
MKLIIVTGGAGFIGSNLISILLKKTRFKIISLDNYYSGYKKNHINNPRVKYIKGHTLDFNRIFYKHRKKINSIFHFGEFSRISNSFDNIDECLRSNINGTLEVLKFCLKNKIRIIYSSTSASLGNKLTNQHLSPYSWSKAKNLDLIINLNLWFGLKYEIIYFYNVYGTNQITKGKMATVIGIFEECYKNKKPLPVVRPGKQRRVFTHINDTVNTCFIAWKKKENKHYAISTKKSYTIMEVAKLFKSEYKFCDKRPGERFKPTKIKYIRGNKINHYVGKIKLHDYIKNIIKPHI